MLSIMASRYRKASITEQLGAWLLLALWTTGTHADPITVTDDESRQVTLEAPAQRIISLAPSMTELLFSLGVGERIVGVMAFSDYPAEAQQIPVVGQYDLIDMEGILASQPDLIVAWRSGNPARALQRLRELGIAVYVAEPDTLASIATQLQRLGQLTGSETRAEALARDFETTLTQLAQQYAGAAPLRVFYQVWHNPLISVGGNELINDMISLCGGTNIFAGLPVGPRVSTEAVLQANPQVIIASGSDAQHPAWLDDWRQWRNLQAVRHEQLHAIPPDLVQRHSLRALEGARQMCEHIDSARLAYQDSQD